MRTPRSKAEAQALLDYLSQGERAMTDYGDVRQRESQQIQEYLMLLPDAIARGDLEYVQFVNALINQPEIAGTQTQGTLAMLQQSVRE